MKITRLTEEPFPAPHEPRSAVCFAFWAVRKEVLHQTGSSRIQGFHFLQHNVSV